jgi:zinc protease
LTIEVRPFSEALSAAPQGADRSRMPTPESFPQAEFPAFEQTVLANGMRLIVAERHSVPVVEFRLLLDSGYAADQFAAPGVATMAMSMLDEGTATMDALEISDTLARLGASLSSGANLDFSTVNLSALKENLDASLGVYADVILRPAFAESDLERLRRLQLASIQQEKNTPMDMALRVVPELLYGPGHAYSLPMTGSGDEEVVRTLTRADLVDFHRTWFAPNNATLVVVGDTTMAEIAPKLERLFGSWRAADVPDKALPNAPLPDAPRVFIVDRPGAPQSIVFASHLVPAKDQATDIAMDAMNDILGGTFVSRINMNLREDKAWAYGARSTIVETQAQRPFIAYAPVQADKTAESMVEIRNEIAGMAGPRPVTPQETAASKQRATLSLPGQWETAGAVAGDIAWLVRFKMPDDYWDRYPALVEALDAAQVDAMADSTLAPDRLTWVVVGDRRLIEAPIRALGFGEVTIIDVDGNPVASR